MKNWRDSASLILAARQAQMRHAAEATFDYKVLSLKRHAKSSFMPSTYVFPGGVVDPSDADLKWKKLFSAFGFNEESFVPLFPEGGSRPVIFKPRRNELPREISLRITAIRETFEECGILLCARTAAKGTLTQWAEHLLLEEAQSWQSRVHEDPQEFYSMCEGVGCYPNLWALWEWSNWLTPSVDLKRFNAAFFLTCMDTQPPADYERHEMEGLKWETPKGMLDPLISFNLPAPQYYELGRIAKFESIHNLLDFAISRSKKGLQLYMGVKVKMADGLVFLLPGDCMYPEKPSFTEKQILDRSSLTIAEFREQSPVKNRFEFYSVDVKSYTVDNFDNFDGHLPPRSIKSVKVKSTKQ